MSRSSSVRVIELTKHDSPYVFHRVEIEGVEFTAFAVPRNYIMLNGPREPLRGRQGPSSIRSCRGQVKLNGNSHLRQVDGGWWLCDWDQPKVDVSMLSERGRNALVDEFGLPSSRGHVPICEMLYASPAYSALIEWAPLHPRISKRLLQGSMQPYALQERFARDTGLRFERPDPSEEFAWVRELAMSAGDQAGRT